MLFKCFYDDNLAQASYLIACEQTREAIVVDRVALLQARGMKNMSNLTAAMRTG